MITMLIPFQLLASFRFKQNNSFHSLYYRSWLSGREQHSLLILSTLLMVLTWWWLQLLVNKQAWTLQVLVYKFKTLTPTCANRYECLCAFFACSCKCSSMLSFIGTYFLKQCLVAGVHDSYWTHACDVDMMNKILREKFVELYEAPILEHVWFLYKRMLLNMIDEHPFLSLILVDFLVWWEWFKFD